MEHIVLAARQGSGGVAVLRNAGWLIERYIALLEKRPIGADVHASGARLARAGEAIAGMKAGAETFDDGDNVRPDHETLAAGPLDEAAASVEARQSESAWKTEPFEP